MASTFVKFCGLTRVEDVERAVSLGISAAGFVLVPGSPRFIAPAEAAKLRARLPEHVLAVALLKDAEASMVDEAVAALKPDVLQFHGSEAPGFCASFGLPWWRAVPMAVSQDLRQWQRRFSAADALLLDGHAPGAEGGRGKSFDWSRAKGVAGRWILAGGLTPQNVYEAVRTVRPFGVDVSSGIESAPGKKDPEKMRRFIEEVRRGEA